MMNRDILKAIVVEDERYPRLSLLQKLEEFRSQIEVIDACDSYDTALKSILLHRPDLLFWIYNCKDATPFSCSTNSKYPCIRCRASSLQQPMPTGAI